MGKCSVIKIKSKNPKIQKSKNPKIQKSKNPKIQKSKNPKIQKYSVLIKIQFGSINLNIQLY
ncbi:hypothetical protein, partial [Pseudoalteromonas distincta]|uniref:hypothetical protein n=1 Tax=Pseudoalteromonas distincta TaxID=77608 RepID=UPI00051899F7